MSCYAGQWIVQLLVHIIKASRIFCFLLYKSYTKTIIMMICKKCIRYPHRLDILILVYIYLISRNKCIRYKLLTKCQFNTKDFGYYNNITIRTLISRDTVTIMRHEKTTKY